LWRGECEGVVCPLTPDPSPPAGARGGLGVSEFFLRGCAWGFVLLIAGGVSEVVGGCRAKRHCFPFLPSIALSHLLPCFRPACIQFGDCHDWSQTMWID